MKFKLEIECDNDAFRGSALTKEVERILKQVAKEISLLYLSGPIKDTNGNSVGAYGFTNETTE